MSHSGEWRTIYLRKKAQGKTAKQALVVVAVKLLHALYAMLKHRQPYNPSRLLVASATMSRMRHDANNFGGCRERNYPALRGRCGVDRDALMEGKR